MKTKSNPSIILRKNYQPSTNKPTINNQPSMTKPEYESDLEINSIMARYVKTGQVPVGKIAGVFQDLSIPLDFDLAQDKIIQARALFLDLPMDVKDEFRTADELLKAFNSPRGRSKLVSLGILDEKQEPQAPVVGSGAISPTPSKTPDPKDPAS
jgi:hypothetical protein